MKFFRTTILASAIALSLGAAALPALAQFDGANSGQWQERKQQLIETLDLTEAQQAQLQELRQSMRSQYQGTLTDEQRATLRSAIANGENPRAAMRSLNLTNAQRQQLQAARQTFRQGMQSILTQEQQQQLRQMMQAQRGQRGQGRFNR